jgi:eukaryotic-like serine/threonine-protein kinase
MRPGDVVANRFQIEAIAGTGGMGTVYRALDLAAGGRVALKTLAGIGERDAARFTREAAVLAELTHPGVVRYVAHGLTAAHEHYIAMEWLEGETLHERLGRGPLALPDALALGRTAAEALAAAHQRGIVHRDVKPMNLFLVGRDPARVKVLDFGIARHVGHAGLLTHTGAILGTPGYMAPEQVRGETSIDARTDVFCLGCVLYRCLTGTSAFGGDQSLAVLAKILVEDVPPPSTIVPAIPPALDDLVLRMLAKAPAGRPDGGRAVEDELARIAEALARTRGGGAAAAAGAAAGRGTGLEATLPDGGGGRGALGPTVASGGGAWTPDLSGETAATGGRAAITESEQRLVSVVLSGPLPDGSLPDPDRLAATAAAFGGRLERLADGSSLVLFAHEGVAPDHAARAARCALALRDALPGAALVVASGRSAVGRGGGTLVGEVIDRAAAAAAGLASGQIAVDPATAGLLDPRFVLVDRGARRLLGGLRDAGEPVRTLLGRATPLVGRDRELAALEGLWIECADEQVARAALVTAPPGGGKSRLRQELVRRVLQRDERAELLSGHGDSLRAGSPFALIADAIRRACGVREGDSPGGQRAALRARVERCVGEDAADRVTHLLGELVGVAFPADASEALRAARLDPAVKGDAMRAAWIDWLAAECRQHPVLLVLEDLHWGDRGTVELVDAALRELAQLPFMVVALARPEIHDAFPRLWAERAVQELRLPELTRKAGERLARDLLGAEVDTGVIQRIALRANGNAFFLEELIRAVAEGRGDTLPDSVLSVLQLRLDSLGGDAKRVLRAGSVFGERFWRGGVAALTGADPRDGLELLIRRELIAPAPESRLPGEAEYAFRHDLVREAAYATVNAADRVLAHRLAGAWLVDRGYADAVALAGHFSRGEEPARAAEQYARAAAGARAAHDYVAAITHADRGLAGQPAPAVAAALELIRAEALNSRGEHAAAVAAAEAARATVSPGSGPWFEAGDELFFGTTRVGDMHRAIRTLHELAATAAEPDAALHQVRSVARAAIMMLRFGPPGIGPVLAARAEELAGPLRGRLDLSTEQRLLTMRGFDARIRGDVPTCLAAFEDALRACELSHNLREAAFDCLALAGCYHELGADEIAIPFARRGIAIAERIGALTVAPLLQFSLAHFELELGRIAEARAAAAGALERHAGLDAIAAGLLHWLLARAALAEGDLDAAERELARALELLAAFPEWHSIGLATRALVHAARGEHDAARATAGRAILTMRLQAGFEEGECYVRLAEIEVLEAAGDRGGAGRAAAVAIERLEERAARLVEPWRTRFLARGVHAAILSRGARAAV